MIMGEGPKLGRCVGEGMGSGTRKISRSSLIAQVDFYNLAEKYLLLAVAFANILLSL